MMCRGGEVRKLQVEGVPLGLLDDREYDEATFQAQPGDVIVLYSDGVQDQQNPAGEDYGRGRVKQLLKATHTGRAQAVVEAFLSDLDGFAEGGGLTDDQTLIALKVL